MMPIQEVHTVMPIQEVQAVMPIQEVQTAVFVKEVHLESPDPPHFTGQNDAVVCAAIIKHRGRGCTKESAAGACAHAGRTAPRCTASSRRSTGRRRDLRELAHEASYVLPSCNVSGNPREPITQSTRPEARTQPLDRGANSARGRQRRELSHRTDARTQVEDTHQ